MASLSGFIAGALLSLYKVDFFSPLISASRERKRAALYADSSRPLSRRIYLMFVLITRTCRLIYIYRMCGYITSYCQGYTRMLKGEVYRERERERERERYYFRFVFSDASAGVLLRQEAAPDVVAHALRIHHTALAVPGVREGECMYTYIAMYDVRPFVCTCLDRQTERTRVFEKCYSFFYYR